MVKVNENKPGYKNTKLGWIPEDWSDPLLDSVTKRGSGHTPDKSKSEYYNGGIKWISLADSKNLDKGLIFKTEKEISKLGLRNSSAVLHHAGTVVLSRDAGVGKSAVMASEMAVSQHFIAWNTKELLNNWFLYYHLQYRKKEFERIAVGSTIKTIGLPYFKKYHIPLPTLPEQKKIAKILSIWDKSIEKLEKLIELKEQRKKGLMQQLLTGQKRLPGFGKQWKTTNLGEILKPVSRPVEKPKYKYLSLGIRSHCKGIFHKIDFDPAKIMMDTLYIVKEGDLVINITFAWEGAVAIASKDDDGGLVSHRFPTYTFTDLADESYIKSWVKSLNFRHQLGLISPGGAGRNRVLNKKDLLKLKISLPDKIEQKAIAGLIDAFNHELSIQKKKLNTLKIQKKGLMQKLLTGEIRVKTKE